jgi:hypothetical protein
MSVGICIHIVWHSLKLTVPNDLGYVSQYNEVLSKVRGCLSKMIKQPVCDANVTATANAEVKNAWITSPLPPPPPPILCTTVRKSAEGKIILSLLLWKMHTLKTVLNVSCYFIQLI